MWIELRNIHKHYGRIKAVDGITLKIAPGLIHGILGENGAGKSTLMKVMAGFTRKTSGEILVNGQPVSYQDPCRASQQGIGMLYQDPLDFPLLTTLENFILGQTDPVSAQKAAFKKKLTDLSDSLNFNLNPDIQVNRLTVGERQQLELLRLLAMGVQALILDEPTTGISSIQRALLFKALKKLAAEGKTILLVSHKLGDIETLCDKVTVLREGARTGDMDRPFDTDRLMEMMFGRPPAVISRRAEPVGEDVLAMERVAGEGERTGLKDCSVIIRQSEVVGLAGLEGSGQGVFLRIAGGVNRASGGSILISNREMKSGNYHEFKREGVTFMPGSRLEEGLISGLSPAEHTALLEPERSFVIRHKKAAGAAEASMAAFRIKGATDAPVDSLSGGNQQRLLLSFLPEDPALLLLENPTRGLDMESVLWVWQHLRRYCIKKTAIVFSSTDLDEILMAADRVLVFFNGRIIRDVNSDRTDSTELGRAIAGKT